MWRRYFCIVLKTLNYGNKKKTAKTEDVAVELKPVEESVEQKDVQAVDKAVDAVEEPAPARSVQDHVTVVIPYCKEFAQGKELLLHCVPGRRMYASASMCGNR